MSRLRLLLLLSLVLVFALLVEEAAADWPTNPNQGLPFWNNYGSAGPSFSPFFVHYNPEDSSFFFCTTIANNPDAVSYIQKVSHDGNVLWGMDARRVLWWGQLTTRYWLHSLHGVLIVGVNYNRAITDTNRIVFQRVLYDGSYPIGYQGVLIHPEYHDQGANIIVMGVAEDGHGGAYIDWGGGQGGHIYSALSHVDSNGTILWETPVETHRGNTNKTLQSDNQGGVIRFFNDGQGFGHIVRYSYFGDTLWTSTNTIDSVAQTVFGTAVTDSVYAVFYFTSLSGAHLQFYSLSDGALRHSEIIAPSWYGGEGPRTSLYTVRDGFYFTTFLTNPTRTRWRRFNVVGDSVWTNDTLVETRAARFHNGLSYDGRIWFFQNAVTDSMQLRQCRANGVVLNEMLPIRNSIPQAWDDGGIFLIQLSSDTLTYTISYVDTNFVGGVPSPGRVSVVSESALPISTHFGLPYPNPSNSYFTFPITVDYPQPVLLKVYNNLGQEIYSSLTPITTLQRRTSIVWQGRGSQGQPISAGKYFVHIKTRTQQSIYPVIYLK